MHRHIAILFCFLFAAPLYAQSDLTFPHLSVGGNPAYETVVQIVNEIEIDNPIIIEVFQGGTTGNGTPLAVRFDGGAPSTSRSLLLAPFQELTTILTSGGTNLISGWLRIRSTIAGGKISANLLFRQRNGSALVDSVGVPSPQRFRRAIIQVDQREKGSDSGVAFANPDSAAVTVTLDLFQGLNRVSSPLSILLLPNQHFAKLLSEMFPSFGNQQGTLIIETEANHAVPCLALRLDGLQLTSIPVRPLGFVFQYNITSNFGAAVESGFWMFDLIGFNLIGTGKVESPIVDDLAEVTGSWIGTNFQFRYRKVLSGGTTGMVIFNGTSAGQESLTGSDGKSKAISGIVTVTRADGTAISINHFTAFHKFGALPQ